VTGCQTSFCFVDQKEPTETEGISMRLKWESREWLGGWDKKTGIGGMNIGGMCKSLSSTNVCAATTLPQHCIGRIRQIYKAKYPNTSKCQSKQCASHSIWPSSSGFRFQSKIYYSPPHCDWSVLLAGSGLLACILSSYCLATFGNDSIVHLFSALLACHADTY